MHTDRESESDLHVQLRRGLQKDAQIQGLEYESETETWTGFTQIGTCMEKEEQMGTRTGCTTDLAWGAQTGTFDRMHTERELQLKLRRVIQHDAQRQGLTKEAETGTRTGCTQTIPNGDSDTTTQTGTCMGSTDGTRTGCIQSRLIWAANIYLYETRRMHTEGTCMGSPDGDLARMHSDMNFHGKHRWGLGKDVPGEVLAWEAQVIILTGCARTGTWMGSTYWD